MFDKDRIITCGSDLVGWRASANTAMASLVGTGLTNSTSGFYVNDLPGVDFDIISETLSDDWADVPTYLQAIWQSELQNLVSRVVQMYKNEFTAKELISNHPFTSGIADFKDTITQNARFVGYLITPLPSNNLKNTITYIGMQINTIQSNPLRIYLYETSQEQPIATFNLTNTKANSLEWFAVTDFIMNYQSLLYGTGQEYMLGYYEADPNNAQTFQLEGNALKTEFDCGCGTNPAKVWRKFLGIEPIEVPNGGLTWNAARGDYDLPDIDEITFVDTIHGLQAKVNVECDITEVLCANIHLFAEALQHAIASRVLLDAFASVRINSISESKKTQSRDFGIKYQSELEGFTPEDGPPKKGIIHSIILDLEGVDSFCLPCEQKRPMKGRIVR